MSDVSPNFSSEQVRNVERVPGTRAEAGSILAVAFLSHAIRRLDNKTEKRS